MSAAFLAVPVVRAGGRLRQAGVLAVVVASVVGLSAARAAVDPAPAAVAPSADVAPGVGAAAAATTAPGVVSAQAASARSAAPAPTDNDPPGEGLGVLAASLAAAVWVIGQRLR